MLKNNRISYFTLIFITISLGILSRKMDGIPTFFGDTLYAVMVYFGIRMFFINLNLKKTALLALVFCFSIEFLQLCRAEWIVAIRSTTLGHYALGQGFLWSDLGYYTLGSILAFWIDFNWVKRN
jgi:glycopeptide antibiotics resistance protein